MKYVLDTHTWIWWHINPNKLSNKVIKLISNQNNYDELLLSEISPWEFCKLIEKGRLQINIPSEKWIEKALDMPRLRLCQLSPDIACQSTTLLQPFHYDPADQIIVSTAILESAILITKDERLQGYAHVKTFW